MATAEPFAPAEPSKTMKPGSSERYSLVTISVQIKTDGAGMSYEQIEDTCARLVKVAHGRARKRHVSAACGIISKSSSGPLYGN